MMNPLLQDANQELENVGIEGFEVLSESYSPETFGNAEVVYKIEDFIVKIVRDRGQDIISLSSKIRPEEFYPFCDVSIVMGWQSMNEVVTTFDPPSLACAIGQISTTIAGLNSAFSTQNYISTKSKLLNTERCRVKAIFG